MVEVNLTPELRFPEFNSPLSSNKMGDLTKINQGLQIAISNRLTEPVEWAYFYITNEFLREGNKKEYYILNPPKSVICNENDVLMTRTGNTGQVVTGVSGAFHNNFFKIKYDNALLDKDYLVYFLRLTKTQNQILRYAGTSTIPDLNHGDFYRLKIELPSITEQQKIASFLTAVDQRIQLLQKKKAKLEEYKKGVMQQLFSQQIRFKPAPSGAEGDENGNDFPDWEEKRLEEVVDYEQPTKYLVSHTEYKEDYPIPVLTAGKTFLLGYTNETGGVFEEKLPTIIFDDFTTAFQFVDFPFKAKSSAMKMLIPNAENVNIRFVFEAMKTIKFPLAEHKRYWISEYQKERIPYPSISEQNKIIEFLTSIDNSIISIGKKVEGTTTFKKGLLQKMFV